MEITISGIGSSQTAAASGIPTAPRARLSLNSSGAATRAGNSIGGDGSVELLPLSTGSFTHGVRGDGGYRYIYATFRVRNAQSDGVAYEVERQNLTFLAVATNRTLQGTAISQMRRFDGSPADEAIALEVLPTGAVLQERDGAIMPRFADVLQVFTEAEVAGMPAGAGVNNLPYGFVVSNPDLSTSRALPALPAAGEYDGIVTFAFRIPLQATSAEDPFTLSVMVQAIDDPVTRVTQSIEEQGPGQMMFEERAAAIGASSVTLLAGGAFAGTLPSRTLCVVRTAGSPGAPTATLGAAESCVSAGMPLTWSGAISSDWSDRLNWIPQLVPTPRDTVLIPPAPRVPIIDADRSIGSLVISDSLSSGIDLGGYTLTIGGDLDAPAGALTNGTVRMTGSGAGLAGTFSDLAIAGNVQLRGSTTVHGPITVQGTLETAGNPLTISLP